ncbi:Ferric/cupric transmembrane component 7 [Cyphellophora attinorum]|uniref:ferric-chelate reductase (NADPH) n=1 Tax=Cyphellophora attinorum TaxID=1664694 RepID=A0A0N1HL76_9EURO|nr:Ferric/cupric transmembrane component 7 [Phialophora attinorum]KPI37685.1 Ferric/cupric transmembrane component 7 [Phialophora attinorum]
MAPSSLPDVLFAEEVISLPQLAELHRRVNIPINSTTPPALVDAIQQDPFSSSAKYSLLFVYFAMILLGSTAFMRMYHYWGDKIRTALHKEDVIESAKEWTANSAIDNEGSAFPESSQTDSSTRHFFPSTGPLIPQNPKKQAPMSAITPINNLIAFCRFVFYRPVPALRIWKFTFGFPSLNVIVIVFAAVASSMLYCFLPQPYFYASMSYGSAPLAIRAGMISVSLLPWIVLTSSKANLLTYMTGIDHQRLMVLHRWTAYICAMFAVVHAVPYWWQSIHDENGFVVFKLYFNQQYYIFTTGIAAIAPLAFLVFHSLPILRSRLYELFVILHAPVAYGFIGLLFWHCNNYLTSWSYLYSTIALASVSLVLRLFYLNWTNPLRASFLIGEESAVTILPENAVKVTIPTQKKWKPGQYVYLRMPGVALFENHPFCIASLCSEDFPSEYGEQYRDMMLIFRPFGGFTRKLYDTALKKALTKLIAPILMDLMVLDLVKRMRDGKATTTNVTVIWAMKRPELMEWFKEELRICREHAPPGSMQCHFFITAAKRYDPYAAGTYTSHRESQRYSGLKEKINDALQGVASKRNSALIPDGYEPDMKEQLDRLDTSHQEQNDTITALPQNAYLSPNSARRMNQHIAQQYSPQREYFPPPPASAKRKHIIHSAVHITHHAVRQQQYTHPISPPSNSITTAHRHSFNFGFPQTPTPFQKNLMRFAFLPGTLPSTVATHHFGADSGAYPSMAAPAFGRDGWRTEYGRPDIPYLLKGLAREFGRRSCVYVCGPPQMRVDVSRTVAELQSEVWTSGGRRSKKGRIDEIYLHAENYAL